MQASNPSGMAPWPRYCTKAFPAYPFLPGRTPHPRRHPLGHSFGEPEPRTLPFEPEQWASSEAYLYGVDLYNCGYWWESHEIFEGLWHACGRTSPAGNFFQALIQFAAANLKRALDNEVAARNLTRHALARLQNSPAHYMGLDTAAFAGHMMLWLNNSRPYVPIHLAWPGNVEENCRR